MKIRKNPETIAVSGSSWWRLLDSNQWPHACEGFRYISDLTIAVQLLQESVYYPICNGFRKGPKRAQANTIVYAKECIVRYSI